MPPSESDRTISGSLSTRLSTNAHVAPLANVKISKRAQRELRDRKHRYLRHLDSELAVASAYVTIVSRTKSTGFIHTVRVFRAMRATCFLCANYADVQPSTRGQIGTTSPIFRQTGMILRSEISQCIAVSASRRISSPTRLPRFTKSAQSMLKNNLGAMDHFGGPILRNRRS